MLNRWRPWLLTALMICTMIGPATCAAQAQGALPVPRFVSLRSDEVNVRAGPGVRYPVKWVFRRRYMPVEIIAEYDTWRKIRDWEGSEGWVHRAMLSSKRSLIVTADETTLRRDPTEEAPAVARLGAGIVARVAECNANWCRVDLDDYDGWVRRDGFWGLYDGEELE